MIKELKFNGDESKFLFLSDLHHSHDREFIWGRRGFNSIEESNRVLIERWNAKCDEESIVFHLGDFIFSDGTGENFYKVIERLKFKELHLLWGNHTSGQRQAYFFQLKQQFGDVNYEVYPLSFIHKGKKIVFLPQYVEVNINSTMLVLCHYPIISHNYQSKNSIHLSGHTHSNCELTNKNNGRGFRLDVGVESFGEPVSLKEVKMHLNGRSLDLTDHH
jgi:calcineurin-like phosphoesterase family protein